MGSLFSTPAGDAFNDRQHRGPLLDMSQSHAYKIIFGSCSKNPGEGALLHGVFPGMSHHRELDDFIVVFFRNDIHRFDFKVVIDFDHDGKHWNVQEGDLEEPYTDLLEMPSELSFDEVQQIFKDYEPPAFDQDNFNSHHYAREMWDRLCF
ncbi:hypothetical protein M3Y99_00293200 [Aphelenchoides fujianensis]|nr:hypothetical protein M3Y99_00293200 [Aphelenchoides fujianensis]